MEAARHAHVYIPKYSRALVSIPISYLSHKPHLHLTPIAPYRNFAVACGLTLLVACLSSPYVMGHASSVAPHA